MRKSLILLLVLALALSLSACNSRVVPEPHVPGDSDTPPQQPTEPLPPTPSAPELPAAFMVMVDNHSPARPQHGLTKADIVYEFVCETGITRLLAAFHSQDPVRVGPIRSIRYYYLNVARAYNLPLAHVGGNMDAMALRTPLGIKSICDITNAGGAFFVDPKRTRPHSTYITSERLLATANSRGYAKLGLPALPRGEFPGNTAVSEVSLTYGTRYGVKWVYQAATGDYKRFINGQPHPTEEATVITADNIIIIEAPVKTVQVPIDGVQSEINIIGQGAALFLRDGKMMRGTWRKDRPESHFRYTLEDGSEFTYAPGNVWIQQVHSLARDVVFR